MPWLAPPARRGLCAWLRRADLRGPRGSVRSRDLPPLFRRVLDETGGDVAQLDVGVAGQPGQEGERALFVQVVPLDQDADRGTDLLSRPQRLVQVVHLLGVPECDGGLGGEHLGGGGRVLGDPVGACRVQVEAAVVPCSSTYSLSAI